MPDYNLTLQCDSSYWHGPCKNCKDVDINRRQKLQSRRDKACLTYHKYAKINIIRLCECLIKEEDELVKLLSYYIGKIEGGEKLYLDRLKSN